MKGYIICNATLVNEGKTDVANVVITGDKIEKIIKGNCTFDNPQYAAYTRIDASGCYLMPGVIDDQVHFREPGLTHKADIATESRAAIAGGVTSFMEMPNTIPQTLTQELLQQKYELGAEKSVANYSFYMGASNDNLDEVLKTNPLEVCGIKVFMGSSTGNMLVDRDEVLSNIFKNAPCLVATHCEDEATIQENLKRYQQEYGDQAPASVHPLIRSTEACYRSSAKAVELASHYNTRLHVLHLSTAKEMTLFRNDIPLEQKRITAEVCLHHLWFNDSYYDKRGNFIKWNPAVKTENDRLALIAAVNDNHIDVVATDHAPHTLEEKQRPYFKAPSGGPMVQHLLQGMLQLHLQGYFSLTKVVEMLCHNPAQLFQIDRRGFVREGYYADLVIVDPRQTEDVNNDAVLYKCKWTALNGFSLQHKVTHTFVNGKLVFHNGSIDDSTRGKKLMFNR